MPSERLVWELASGTGEHVLHCAAAFPHLVWQPSDPAAAHRRSIEGYRRAAGGANLRAPLDIDVTASAWPLEGPVDAMVCCNMIHIAPWAAAEGLLAGAARYRRPGGGLYPSGPVKREAGHRATPTPRPDDGTTTPDPA